MKTTRGARQGDTSTTVLVPLGRLNIGEQIRGRGGRSDEDIELRLKIDELERSMWIDLARGLPFWSTLVVQPSSGERDSETYVVVDGERRLRALRRLRAHLPRELASDEWTTEQKQNMRRLIETRDTVPCRVVPVEGAERKGLQFRANKSLPLTTAELKDVYRSLFADYYLRSKGRPYTPTAPIDEAERSKLWRLVAQETGERATKVVAIGSLDEFQTAGGNCRELARRALLDRSDPDSIDFSWVEGINTMFRREHWDQIAGKVIRGEIRSVATRGGLRDYARAIYDETHAGQGVVGTMAREGLLSVEGFAPHHAEALSYLGDDFVRSQGDPLLELFAGKPAEETKTLARHLLQHTNLSVEPPVPTVEDYYGEVVALVYKLGQKLNPDFAQYVPKDIRFRQLVQTLGAFQIKLNEFVSSLRDVTEHATDEKQIAESTRRDN